MEWVKEPARIRTTAFGCFVNSRSDAVWTTAKPLSPYSLRETQSDKSCIPPHRTAPNGMSVWRPRVISLFCFPSTTESNKVRRNVVALYHFYSRKSSSPLSLSRVLLSHDAREYFFYANFAPRTGMATARKKKWSSWGYNEFQNKLKKCGVFMHKVLPRTLVTTSKNNAKRWWTEFSGKE